MFLAVTLPKGSEWFLIRPQLLQELTNYLATRPWGESNNFIQAIANLQSVKAEQVSGQLHNQKHANNPSS